MTTRVLLGQLGSNGDCLYATTIARQIKSDFPGCHLTWAISSLCRKVIENNPDVDAIWEVHVDGWADMTRAWHAFEREAWAAVADGAYDHAFMTQISPNYFGNYDGTVRPSIFRNYPNPITVPVESVIELTSQERAHVDEWVKLNKIESYKNVVLVECSSKSGQSSMTPDIALKMAERLVVALRDTCVIISTHEVFHSTKPNIIHGGELSMRETALLTHFADLFIGCGSGLTVVATSSAAKQNLPNVQVLNRSTSVYASFKHDFEYFGKNADHFLETTKSNPRHLALIAKMILKNGLAAAKRRYAEQIPVHFTWYFGLIDQMLLREHRFVDAAQSLLVTAERYGWTKELRNFARALVLPFLDLDTRSSFPHGKKVIERFRRSLETASKGRKDRFNQQKDSDVRQVVSAG